MRRVIGKWCVTIIEALRILLPDLDGGPFIYSIRDRVREDDPDFEGSSWDHPKVKRAAEAIDTIKVFLNEDGDD